MAALALPDRTQPAARRRTDRHSDRQAVRHLRRRRLRLDLRREARRRRGPANRLYISYGPDVEQHCRRLVANSIHLPTETKSGLQEVQSDAIVPTISDRIAQTVVRSYLEPDVEPVFHEDSYGYRPGRSAHQALRVCRERCWRQDWVLDLDLKSFFDSVSWDLVLKAAAHHTNQRWILLYVERWLKAPLQREDGKLVTRDRGTPQGSALTAPTQSQTSSSNGRFRGRGEGVGREAWYSSG